MRIISRNPFGRYDVIRRNVNRTQADISKGCSWCGQVKQNKYGMTFLYQYGINQDQNNRNDWNDKLFCSKSCFNSYTE